MFMEQENKGKFQTLQNTSHTDSGKKQLKIYNYNYNYDYNYINYDYNYKHNYLYNSKKSTCK